MSEYFFTAHAKDMLKEREIMEEWVLQTIRNPNKGIWAVMAMHIISDYYLNVTITFYM